MVGCHGRFQPSVLLLYEKKTLTSLQETLTNFRHFVQLRDLMPRSQNTYVAHVRLIGEFFQSDPASLSEDQVRHYFLFLRQDKQYKSSTMNQAKVSLRTFYRDFQEVDPPWRLWDEIIVRHRETLPVVLSKKEVHLLLSKVTEPRFHTCLSLIYSCGLRLSEAIAVEVSDIDSENGRLYVRKGKGGKPRHVPISSVMIQRLRDWWVYHKHSKLLFPAVGRRWKTSQRGDAAAEERMKQAAMQKAEKPMSNSTVQNAIKWAVAAAGFKKRVSVHTLRHCYATHLLDSGISLRYISNYLGHASLNQTLVYAHLSSVGEQRTQEVLSALDQDVIGKPEN